jgi:hypothetical protein
VDGQCVREPPGRHSLCVSPDDQAKTAYDAHKKDTATYEKVAGLKNALYFSEGPAVEVLKGKVLVNVQGVFLEEISTDAVDVKAQLVQLAKKAAPRV